MRLNQPTLRSIARILIASALLAWPDLAQSQSRPSRAPARPAVTSEPLPLPPPVPPEPGEEAAPATLPEATPAPLAAAPPQRLQRRIGLAELGLTEGLAFDPFGRDLFFPIPRDITGLAGRLHLVLDLAAPFGGRHAVELRANGRLLGSHAFAEGQTRLAVELPVTADDLSREVEALRLNLRLVEQPSPASAVATLRAESHLALLLPDEMAPSVAALFRLLPLRTQILMRPGAVPPAEAAAALRIGLALTGSGREVMITTGAPPEATFGPDGQRIWDSGTVVVGLGQQGAAVMELSGLPTLTLGGPEPERAARLLDSPFRASAAVPALGVAEARTPPAPATSLPFSALRGSLLPQNAERATWSLDFSTRDLPSGTRPEALEVEFRTAPDPAGGRPVLTVLLNEVMLGAATLPAEGRARLSLPVPERLVGLDNRIGIVLHRPSATGPAQPLPTSAIRLGPAGAPREFLALPPAYAAGVEVFVDAPGGVLAAEALNPLLWVLRALVPASAPIAVTLVEPGTAPRPTGAFLAATRMPPAGTTPTLRFDAGQVVLTDRDGRALLDIGGIQRVLAAQLLRAEGAPGLWLRLPALLPALPSAAPRLDRGDIALLDRQGVALAWSTAEAAPLVRVAYPEARQEVSAILAWRPYVVALLWVAGMGLVVYAFARPRREWPG